MKYLVCVIIFFSAILPAPSLQAHTTEGKKTFRVGVMEKHPSSTGGNKDKSLGLYPDLFKRIADEENWAVEFVPGSWTEGLERLQRGDIDLMTGIAFSPERSLVMDFSKEPVFELWGQVFLKPGKNINTIVDLDGLPVAVMAQDINGQNFIKTAAQFRVSCEIIELPTQTDVFLAIQNGEVAAGVASQHFGMRNARDFDVVASPIQFSPFSVYFAAKKGFHGPCLDRIDAYLSRWKQAKDSYYYNRLSYWMGGKEYEKEIIPRWLLLTIGAIAAVLALLTYLNATLNRTVKKRTRELHNREKQYRDLVESANSIILRMDKHGRVLFINRFGLDLFGYSREELYGRNVIGTILTPKEAEANHFKAMDKETFELPEAYEFIENENICKDGRVVYIQWSNRAITDDEGHFHEILSIGTDITQRRQLEASLSQAQKMEAIGTLAGGIAHDFNNILTVIFGYTELASLDIDNNEKVREALEQVTQSGKRAKELVSQILTFSRKSESEKQPLQPSLIIKETVKLLRPSLPATITLESSLDSGSKIKADPTQIHQIIMNLCTNAYHAMETTGGTLRISLTDTFINTHDAGSPDAPLTPGDYILLEVSDTGSGIDPTTMQKIFDPYFSTKAKDKGTGLGLSVVHGIVKEHNGHISAHSTPGRNTTFKVLFPILKTYTKPVPEKTAAPLVNGGKESILIVDDEKEITVTLSQILSRQGYKVQAFTDAMEAMASFRSEPDAIDLVITDMTMPGMTGSQLAREMFSLRPELPVILCTGYSDLISIENARKIGIAEYLQKPVMIPTLLQKIRKHLDRRQAAPSDMTGAA
ncbi:hypothetical protein DSLASN_04300 [Desulfoluna limicola]|uniref:histidine kinase n=1 Tax=Desulfoluna limicola TaxID=2810562 RepID=A0ABM7PC73_9BACT|nr:response regulator [Desulfoluna limicola]BCS94798.1 hypothetical protein DSLASN_04300 [Desulfoluna limicola]